MAERISDVPDDADWPELEDEIIPEMDPVSDAGAFERPFAYLHGARATIEGDLLQPTKLLTVTAAKSVLRVAEATDTEIEAPKREHFERIANGEVATDRDELVEALAELTVFVEANMTFEKTEDA